MRLRRHLQAGTGAAFTLVEVISVVLILAVLAAFLLPIFGGARATALSGKCVQKQKHIYMALLAFTEDHQGLLPPDLSQPPGSTEIHPRFNLNQYWWDSAYLGRYVLNQPDRRRDSAGKLIGDDLIPLPMPGTPRQQ